VIHALVYRNSDAQSWLAKTAAWPTHVYVEAAHVVLRLQRTGRISLGRARLVLDGLHAVDADTYPVESLVRPAWETAVSRRLSVYDACYVVLAEALDAPLVTADRRLAASTTNAVLLT